MLSRVRRGSPRAAPLNVPENLLKMKTVSISAVLVVCLLALPALQVHATKAADRQFVRDAGNEGLVTTV